MSKQFDSNWLIQFEARQQSKTQPIDGYGSESDLHAQIFDECRRRGWIALHGSMAERTHRTAGEPDFIILANERIFFVECKTRAGKLSIAQSAMISHAAKLGHTIHVVRSFREFLEIVK